tara:strand:+ start:3474 stop:3644 length:171 start_codon:yes stop_codon:yes gene_type:complete
MKKNKLSSKQWNIISGAVQELLWVLMDDGHPFAFDSDLMCGSELFMDCVCPVCLED